jgi:hypothetical protein
MQSDRSMPVKRMHVTEEALAKTLSYVADIKIVACPNIYWLRSLC